MAGLYRKRGMWYAPEWTSPGGKVIPAHSLKTGDARDAENAWIVERARYINATARPARQLSIGATEDGTTLFSKVIDLYLASKKRGIAPETFRAYEGHKRQIFEQLSDRPVSDFAPPEGTGILQDYIEAEVIRLGGRTHTVKKRLESIIKPALKYAYKQKMIGELPVWPSLSSDYDSVGRREISMSEDEFVALRAALPACSVIEERETKRRITVYPRLWADLAVATGMHSSDLANFRADYWRQLGRSWNRINSKGIKHYPTAWLPCDAHLQETLERAYRDRQWGPKALLVSSEKPYYDLWIFRYLKKAADAAGLPVAPAPIDFRRTFAVWKKDAGWEFDETALWLGNSSGMVRKVYARTPTRQMLGIAEKARSASERLLRKIDGEEVGTAEKQAEKVAGVVQFNPSGPTKKGG